MMLFLKLFLVLFTLTLVLTSCGGGNAGSSSVQPNQTVGSPVVNTEPVNESSFGLPPLAEIAAGLDREASFDDEGYFLGMNYSQTLPSQNVTEEMPGEWEITLSPDWDPASSPAFSGLAFAMFDSTLPDYDPIYSAGISMAWESGSSPPAANRYIAVSNWDTGSWDWREAPGNEDGLEFIDFSPYIREGDDRTLLVVLLTGTEPYYLTDLRISQQQPPNVFLETIDPTSGDAPLTVDFYAENGVNPPFPDYEWDFDGNSTFNEVGAEADARGLETVSHTYTTPGVFNTGVRATNDLGHVSDVSSLEITVNPVDPNAPTAVLEVDESPVEQGEYFEFDASSSFDPDGTIDNYQWDFDGNGVFNEAGAEADSEGFDYAGVEIGIVGTHTISVKVIDNDGKWDIDSLDVEVTDAPPNASFVVNQDQAAPPVVFTFDASGSSDYNSEPLADVEWDFDGDMVFSETGDEADARGNFTPTTEITANNPGVFAFYVKVWDSANQSAISLRNVDADGWSVIELPTGHDGVYASIKGDWNRPYITYQDAGGSGLYYGTAESGGFTNPAAWSFVNIDSSSTAGRRSQVMESGGKRAVIYFDSTTEDIRFLRANSALGLNATDWTGSGSANTIVAEDIGASTEQGFSAQMSGYTYPAVAYYDSTDSSLYYAVCSNSDGSDPADWANVLVHSDAEVNYGERLALVDSAGNFPAITYSYNKTSSGDVNTMFVRSTTTFGGDAGDWATKVTVSADEYPLYISLDRVMANPAMVYQYMDGPDQKLGYRRANNNEGDSGGWAGGTSLVISASGTPGDFVNMVTHRQRPTLVHLAGGGSPTLKFLRSTDNRGDDASDWSGGTAFNVDSGTVPLGQWLAACEVKEGSDTSHIAIVYRNSGGGNLKLATYISPAFP